MAYVAGNTIKISLGTSIVNMFYYTPIMFAKSYATLDVLSQGRVIAGLGLGWSKDEYQASLILNLHEYVMQIEFLNTEIKNIKSKITCEASKNES